MKISLDRTSAVPIYRQISGQIREMIFRGELADGCMLPSERGLAARLQIHRNTVTRAYMELKSEGLIDPRQGRGCRIQYRSTMPEKKRRSVHWDALIEDRYMNIRSSFDELYSISFEEGLIPFGGGVAAREPYPPEEIAECFEKILQSRTYFYTPYQGDEQLRALITALLEERGIRVRPANIQIFSENNQTMDFINSLLLSEGDRVIAPQILSADVYRSIQMAGGTLLTVPMDEDGMICDHLDALIEKHSPKYIYVDPAFNNPTGSCLSLSRRQKLLELSYRYRIPIIEEDESSQLSYDAPPLPSIRSMDPGSNVIYLHSFNLTFRAGLGVSFVCADRSITERLHNMVSVRLAALDWASQMLTLEYMKDGRFQRRIPEFREICRQKRDRMYGHLTKLADRYGLDVRLPAGGVYFWVGLPAGMDAEKLLDLAQRQGVTFIPGNLFYVGGAGGRDRIRLNFSYPSLSQIDAGMRMLEAALAQYRH